ncbi:MAG: hypothetical protein QOK20_3240, partial [Acidimicrobiaceae bacterium]|nr:hypothetical protein [Acidimicrobiaceae bacterium]
MHGVAADTPGAAGNLLDGHPGHRPGFGHEPGSVLGTRPTPLPPRSKWRSSPAVDAERQLVRAGGPVAENDF